MIGKLLAVALLVGLTVLPKLTGAGDGAGQGMRKVEAALGRSLHAQGFAVRPVALSSDREHRGFVVTHPDCPASAFVMVAHQSGDDVGLVRSRVAADQHLWYAYRRTQADAPPSHRVLVADGLALLGYHLGFTPARPEFIFLAIASPRDCGTFRSADWSGIWRRNER